MPLPRSHSPVSARDAPALLRRRTSRLTSATLDRPLAAEDEEDAGNLYPRTSAECLITYARAPLQQIIRFSFSPQDTRPLRGDIRAELQYLVSATSLSGCTCVLPTDCPVPVHDTN